MSIAAGLPTPPLPGRAAHQGTPCDAGACAALTIPSMPSAAAAPAPTPMKSRRPIVDLGTGRFESFMVILLTGCGRNLRRTGEDACPTTQSQHFTSTVGQAS